MLLLTVNLTAMSPFRCDYYVTSEYHSTIGKGGERRNNLHEGLDCGPMLDDWIIVPLMPVTVLKIDHDAIFGKYVIIDHHNGLFTKYAHGSKIFNNALPGSKVSTRTPIMIGGSSGYSSGRHLHVEVYYYIGVDKITINPDYFMKYPAIREYYTSSHCSTNENEYLP